ncbi:MAG: family 16 glycoside hydrolase [Chloroflexota bacterium]
MKPTLLARISTVAVAMLLSLTLFAQSTGVAAQDAPAPAPSPTPDRGPTFQHDAPAGSLRLAGPPPPVGDVIVEDSLTAPGAIPGRLDSVTGRNVGEFVGEGYIMKVTGRFREDSQTAGIGGIIPELVVPDGEIRIEMKVVSGHDRALAYISFREQTDPPAFYEVNLAPSVGLAFLGRSVPNDLKMLPLATRSDLRGRMSRDDWNQFAVRLDGPNIWILLNGEPILSVADSARDSGRVGIGVMRAGDLNDNAESAVVFRNLRVSRLAPRPPAQ